MSTPYLASYVFLWLLVVALAIGVFALYHHFGQMYLTSREGRARHGLAEGTLVKSRWRETVDGARVQIPTPGRLQLMIFTETVCPLRHRLQPDIRNLANRDDGIDVAVVCVGEVRDVQRWARDLRGEVTVIPDPGAALSVKYSVGLSPFVIAIGADQRVRARAIVNDAAGLDWAAERLLVTPLTPDADELAVVPASIT
jgi:hypothetical protein